MDTFITKDMFFNLASCITLVCLIVQLSKGYIPINPIWLNLIVSALITAVRIAFIGDFSFEGIVLGILNVIPILLGATGCYEVGKNVVTSVVS